MITDKTPEERAADAAEALDAEGQKVTMRAIAKRAGVRATVANAAAQEWNARVAEMAATPEVPEVITTRFTAIWREAYQMARVMFDDERAGLLSRVAESDDERAQFAADVTRLEAELDAAKEALATAEARAQLQLDAATARATEAETVAAAAEARAAQAEGVAAGLREALETLKTPTPTRRQPTTRTR